MSAVVLPYQPLEGQMSAVVLPYITRQDKTRRDCSSGEMGNYRPMLQVHVSDKKHCVNDCYTNKGFNREA